MEGYLKPSLVSVGSYHIYQPYLSLTLETLTTHTHTHTHTHVLTLNTNTDNDTWISQKFSKLSEGPAQREQTKLMA